MKITYSILFLGLAIFVSGCSIFKPGCHCPHVVSAGHPQQQVIKRS